MKLIAVGHGKFAKVDDQDYEWISQWKWGCSGQGYACRSKRVNGRKTMIRMHRAIMGFPDSDVDHIDRDKLNNQRSNLRACTEAQTTYNIGLRKSNTTGYIGVDINQGKYRAKIRVNTKRIHIGYYDTPEEAARAYNEAAIQYRGEFAVINTLEPTTP